MFSFSDSDSGDEERSKKPSTNAFRGAWAEQIEQLERLHDEMERDQNSQRGVVRTYIEAGAATEVSSHVTGVWLTHCAHRWKPRARLSRHPKFLLKLLEIQ